MSFQGHKNLGQAVNPPKVIPGQEGVILNYTRGERCPGDTSRNYSTVISLHCSIGSVCLHYDVLKWAWIRT